MEKFINKLRGQSNKFNSDLPRATGSNSGHVGDNLNKQADIENKKIKDAWALHKKVFSSRSLAEAKEAYNEIDPFFSHFNSMTESLMYHIGNKTLEKLCEVINNIQNAQNLLKEDINKINDASNILAKKLNADPSLKDQNLHRMTFDEYKDQLNNTDIMAIDWKELKPQGSQEERIMSLLKTQKYCEALNNKLTNLKENIDEKQAKIQQQIDEYQNAGIDIKCVHQLWSEECGNMEPLYHAEEAIGSLFEKYHTDSHLPKKLEELYAIKVGIQQKRRNLQDNLEKINEAKRLLDQGNAQPLEEIEKTYKRYHQTDNGLTSWQTKIDGKIAEVQQQIKDCQQQAEGEFEAIYEDWKLKKAEFTANSTAAQDMSQKLAAALLITQDPQEIPPAEALLQGYQDLKDAAKIYEEYCIKDLMQRLEAIGRDILTVIRSKTSNTEITDKIARKITNHKDIFKREETKADSAVWRMRQRLGEWYKKLYQESKNTSDVKEAYRKKRETIAIASAMISEESASNPSREEQCRIVMQTLKEDYQQFLQSHPEIIDNYHKNGDTCPIYGAFDHYLIQVQTDMEIGSQFDPLQQSAWDLYQANFLLNNCWKAYNAFMEPFQTSEGRSYHYNHPYFLLADLKERKSIKLRFGALRYKFNELKRDLENLIQSGISIPVNPVYINADQKIIDHNNIEIGGKPFSYLGPLVDINDALDDGSRWDKYKIDNATHSDKNETSNFKIDEIINLEAKEWKLLIKDGQGIKELLTKMGQEIQKIIALPVYLVLSLQTRPED